MPTLPGKQCRVPGCMGKSKPGSNGYCEKHKNSGWAAYQKQNPNRIYSTTRWKKVRGVVIRRACGLCENCYKKGVYKKGTDCDHIKSISSGGNPFDIDNLQLLCKECHKAKTANE